MWHIYDCKGLDVVGFNTNHASNTCEEYYLLGCSLIHQQFGETYYIHLQGESVSQVNSMQELLLSAYLRPCIPIDVFDVHHVCSISDKNINL